MAERLTTPNVHWRLKSEGFVSLFSALVVILLPWLMFWPVAIGKMIWAGGDISAYHFPLMVTSSAAWRQGDLPLWNAGIYGGAPLAAAFQASVFYVLNVVQWLVWPPWLMLGHSVLLHLSLAGLSVFLFLRSVRLHPLAALLGGLAFGLSGFAMSHIGHVNIERVLPWPGFVLYGMNRWVDSGRRGWLAFVALATSQLVMSGYVQVITYGLMLIATYPIALAIGPGRVGLRKLWIVFAALSLGVGLGAIQLVPTAHMWFGGEYLRPGEASYEAFTRFSLHPAYLLTLLLPHGREGTYAEMVLYVGIAPLCLALVGIVIRQEEDIVGRVRWFFTGWLAIALILAFGQFIPPVARVLFRIPVYKGLAVPSRHLLEVVLSLAVLAGIGSDWLLRGRRASVSSVVSGRAVAVLAFSIGALIFLALKTPYTQENPPVAIMLRRDVWRSALLLATTFSLGAVVYRNRKRVGGHLAAALLIPVCIVDLVSFGYPVYSRFLTPPSFYTEPPLTAGALRRDAGRDPFRIIAFEAQGNAIDKDVAKALLGANFSAAYQVESVIGLDGLMPKVVYDAAQGVIPPWGYVSPGAIDDARFRDLLDLWGVQYLLARAGKEGSAAAHYPLYDTIDGVRVFKNENAYPRLFLAVPSKVTVQPPQAYGERLYLQGYALETDWASELPGSLVLSTWWNCESPVNADYTLYVHYLDAVGTTVAQDDHVLGRTAAGQVSPTSQWECPGLYRDVTSIPSGDQNGQLRVAFGLWIPETGERLQSTGELRVDEFGRTRLGNGHDVLQIRERASTLADDYGMIWMPIRTMVPGIVRIRAYAGNRISAEVDFTEDGLLVHSANYISGWRAAVDEQLEPVIRINGLLQAVRVTKGHHVVEFWYEPYAVWAGAAISLLSLIALLYVVLLPRSRAPQTRDL